MKRLLFIATLVVLVANGAFALSNSGSAGRALLNDSAAATCFLCNMKDTTATARDSSVVIPIYDASINHLQFAMRLNAADTGTVLFVLHGARYSVIDSTSYDVRLDSVAVLGGGAIGLTKWWKPTATTNIYVPYVWIEVKHQASTSASGGVAGGTLGPPAYRIWYWKKFPQ